MAAIKIIKLFLDSLSNLSEPKFPNWERIHRGHNLHLFGTCTQIVNEQFWHLVCKSVSARFYHHNNTYLKTTTICIAVVSVVHNLYTSSLLIVTLTLFVIILLLR